MSAAVAAETGLAVMACWEAIVATAMGRSGQPEEVAAAILWLLSGEASYVTGAILDVSGGR